MKKLFMALLFLSILSIGFIRGMKDGGLESVIFTPPKNSAQEITRLFQSYPLKPDETNQIESFFTVCVTDAATQALAILEIPERYGELAKKSCSDADYLCGLHFKLVSGIAAGTIGLTSSPLVVATVKAKKKVDKAESTSLLTSMFQAGLKLKNRLMRATHNKLNPYEVLGLTNSGERRRTTACYDTIAALLAPQEGKKKAVINVIKYKKMFERLTRRVEKTTQYAFEICRTNRNNPTKAIELMNALIKINSHAFPQSLLNAINTVFFTERIKALSEFTTLASVHVPKANEVPAKKDAADEED